MGTLALNLVYINTSIQNPNLYIILLLGSGFIGGSVCILIPAITKVLALMKLLQHY